MNENSIGRRRFLGILVKLSTVLPAGVLLAAPVEKARRRVSIRALGPFLNTLLPEDVTPGATQLGVDKALIAHARHNRRFARLIALGCAWLDKQAGDLGAEEFAALPEKDRETLVTRAEQASAKSLPRQFFLRTRERAFTEYYAQPAAWRELGYAGPPQPRGFTDYAHRPESNIT